MFITLIDHFDVLASNGFYNPLSLAGVYDVAGVVYGGVLTATSQKSDTLHRRDDKHDTPHAIYYTRIRWGTSASYDAFGAAYID